MSYQVLARKWRPKKFEEVIGQDHIVNTIKNSIGHNRIAHAYLLTGTRGVGKTTIARLFAKALMCQNLDSNMNPCGTCSSCASIDDGSSIDYLEIDGATNNGVDSIRQLIDNVQYLPVSGKYKVYVIDEVHMLSVSAFNALLKTLEEPPKHVVFIFATTDPQKLLGTVLSRCQRFDFKNLSREELIKHIQLIAKNENINFDKINTIELLAKRGKGSVRDTLSLLDQALSLSDGRFINEEVLTSSLGIVNTSALKTIVESIIIGDSQNISSSFQSILKENVDLKIFIEQISEKFYDLIQSLDTNEIDTDISTELINSMSASELFWIYETLIKEVSWGLNSISPSESLEIILKKITLRRMLLENSSAQIALKKKDKKIVSEDIVAEKIKEDSQWDKFLADIFIKNAAIAANLEHGNIINFSKTAEELNILFGFKDENKVFYEYITDAKIYNSVLLNLAEFFNFEEQNINFEIIIIDKNEAETKKFRSKSEIVKENIEQDKLDKKKKLLSNEFVKEAEKIFLTKVDKIILKEE